MEVDVEDDFALDPQVEVEDEAVDDVPDRPLDGVLQGDEAEVDLRPVRTDSSTSTSEASGMISPPA